MDANRAEHHRSDLPIADPAGRLLLRLTQDDAVEIVERLRESHADALGRVFLIRLDYLAERLGPRWDTKRDLVFQQLTENFEKKFTEPDWCVRVNDDSFLMVIPTLGEHKGAMNAAEFWYATGQFFVGDVSKIAPPLFEVIAADVDLLQLIPIDLNSYFDRARARPLADVREPVPAPDEAGAEKPAYLYKMNEIQRHIDEVSLLSIRGRRLRVTSSLEPVFEMKKLSMIGYRFEPHMVEGGHVTMDGRFIDMLDWSEREQVDIANIEQGIRILQKRTPEQRKFAMVVPAAFTTFASTRARSKILGLIREAAREMRLKVIFEVRQLKGVPPGRVSEIAFMLKPYCMTVMGQSGAEARAIMSLKDCGLSGTCIDFDGDARDEATLETYLSSLSQAARASTGACLVQGFLSLRQMAVARLAGVTHASVRAAALSASKS